MAFIRRSGEMRVDHFVWTIPEDYPVAGDTGSGVIRICDWIGYKYPYAAEGSRTLVDDAKAVLNGDADHLLGNNELLADFDGLHEMDQGNVDAVNPRAINIPVVPQANSPPQVPAAPVVPQVNNQVNHVAITALPQCLHGCPGTFGRPGELRRHMKKHNGPFFPCTHPNCGKMFYRQDKLRDHLAKGH